jgi:uncharacterized membrane protein HdeD (DUF308 family)
MSAQSIAVFMGVLYFIGALLLLTGIGMIIGAQFLKRYPRESRTLARCGIIVIVFGILGIIWPLCSVPLLIAVVLLGILKSCSSLE